MSGRAGEIDAGFPVAHCARCKRDVLTHVHLDARGEERRLCLGCDAELDPGEVDWVQEDALETLGYEVSNVSEGCGRAGCGQGRCGRP